jgi:TPR repeat protein
MTGSMSRQDVISALTDARDPEFLFAREYLLDAGIDIGIDPDGSLALLAERAKEGVPEAQVSLAKLLITGACGRIDHREAFDYCNRAAATGYPPAMVLMASFLSEGWGGVDRDLHRAIDHLRRAADCGYGHAMALLYSAYTEGIGVEKDGEAGERYLEMAAEHGEPNSSYLLGVTLSDGADIATVTRGVSFLQRAANAGISAAHRQLADIFKSGRPGVPVDSVLAAKHLASADDLDRRS